jgi:serine/threonine-protein kinase
VADSIPAKTGQPGYRVRAEAYGFLGDTNMFTNAGQSREPLQKSLEIAREWVKAEPTADSRYFLAVALERWGIALAGLGDLGQAQSALFEATSTLDALLKQEPDNAVWKRERSALDERIGMVAGHPQYFNLGDSKTATRFFERLVADQERLLAVDPNNTRAREDLSEAYADLAASLRDSDPPRAERLYRRSFELSGSFLAANPEDWEARYWQSFDRIGFAWVLRRLGKTHEALDQLERCHSTLTRLIDRDPKNPDNRQLLGVALQASGTIRLESGDRAGAERDLQQSIAVLGGLRHELPRKLTLVNDLAEAHEAYGNLHASRGDWHSAEAEYRHALALWDEWPSLGISSIYDQQRREHTAKLVTRAASRQK